MRCLSSQQMLPTISPSIHPSLNICSTVSFCKRTSPRKARAHTRRLRLSYTDTKPRGRAVGTSARKTCMRDVSGEATLPTWRLLRRNARAGARVWWGNYPCMVGELLMGTAQAHMLAETRRLLLGHMLADQSRFYRFRALARAYPHKRPSRRHTTSSPRARGRSFARARSSVSGCAFWGTRAHELLCSHTRASIRAIADSPLEDGHRLLEGLRVTAIVTRR